MNDVSQIPKVTERLLAEGYTRADLEKIWGGNILRVLKAAEDYAAAQRPTQTAAAIVEDGHGH